MKIVPHNFIHMIIILFMPWRWGKNYILIEKQKITFSRYYCFDEKTLKRDIAIFSMEEIKQIGFPQDLGINMQEKTVKGMNGTYISQEIDFMTESSVFALNVRPYTKKQIRTFIEILLKDNPNIVCSKRLKKVLGIS